MFGDVSKDSVSFKICSCATKALMAAKKKCWEAGAAKVPTVGDVQTYCID